MFFGGVDSKSAIDFYRPTLENPDNPEKTIFPDYRGFPVSDYGIILLYAHIKKHVFFLFIINVFGCRFQICNPFFSADTEKPQ